MLRLATNSRKTILLLTIGLCAVGLLTILSSSLPTISPVKAQGPRVFTATVDYNTVTINNFEYMLGGFVTPVKGQLSAEYNNYAEVDNTGITKPVYDISPHPGDGRFENRTMYRMPSGAMLKNGALIQTTHGQIPDGWNSTGYKPPYPPGAPPYSPVDIVDRYEFDTNDLLRYARYAIQGDIDLMWAPIAVMDPTFKNGVNSWCNDGLVVLPPSEDPTVHYRKILWGTSYSGAASPCACYSANDSNSWGMLCSTYDGSGATCASLQATCLPGDTIWECLTRRRVNEIIDAVEQAVLEAQTPGSSVAEALGRTFNAEEAAQRKIQLLTNWDYSNEEDGADPFPSFEPANIVYTIVAEELAARYYSIRPQCQLYEYTSKPTLPNKCFCRCGIPPADVPCSCSDPAHWHDSNCAIETALGIIAYSPLNWDVAYIKDHFYPYQCLAGGLPDKPNIPAHTAVGFCGDNSSCYPATTFEGLEISDRLFGLKFISPTYECSLGYAQALYPTELANVKYGFGEYNLSGACPKDTDPPNATMYLSDKIGSAFYYLDSLLYLAESGIGLVNRISSVGGSFIFSLFEMESASPPDRYPSANMYAYMARFLGSKVLYTIPNWADAEYPFLSVHATKDYDDHGMTIVLVNKHNNSPSSDLRTFDVDVTTSKVVDINSVKSINIFSSELSFDENTWNYILMPSGDSRPTTPKYGSNSTDSRTFVSSSIADPIDDSNLTVSAIPGGFNLQYANVGGRTVVFIRLEFAEDISTYPYIKLGLSKPAGGLACGSNYYQKQAWMSLVRILVGGEEETVWSGFLTNSCPDDLYILPVDPTVLGNESYIIYVNVEGCDSILEPCVILPQSLIDARNSSNPIFIDATRYEGDVTKCTLGNPNGTGATIPLLGCTTIAGAPDDLINQQDLDVLASYIAAMIPASTAPRLDLNRDGVINDTDYQIAARNFSHSWLNECPPARIR